MFGLFLLGAALSVGQAEMPPPPPSAVDPPALEAGASSLLASPETPSPDSPVVPDETPAPEVPAAVPLFPARVWLPVDVTEQPQAPAPPTAKADEAKPVDITLPVLVIPPPPPPPVVPPATTPPDRWALQKCLQGTGPGVFMDTERISIYGWFEASYTMSSVPANNLPLSWNYRAWEPDLQQSWIRFNRSVVTTGTTEPTWGWNVDFFFGTDYRFTLERGIYNKQLTDRDGLPAIYGIDPVQFYLEAYFPTVIRGLDVKVGRFYTPWGVESVEAPSTPFMSRSYTFSNAPPFTHTGILLTQNLPCNFIVQAALVVGEDLFIDPADEATFIGTIQYNRQVNGVNRDIFKLAALLDSGWFNQNEGFSGVQGNPNFCNVDFVWTHYFDSVPRLTYNLETIYGWMNNVPDAIGQDGFSTVHIGTANWWGVVNYLSYTVCPSLIANTRFEVFDDAQGIRNNSLPGASVENAKGLYTALTFGLTYKPRRQPSGNAIFEVRPEVRFDRNWDSKPFDNAHHNLLTAGTDVIFRW